MDFMDDEILATEPDCPNCGTRTIPSLGAYTCRTCKILVHPATGL